MEFKFEAKLDKHIIQNMNEFLFMHKLYLFKP